MEPINIEAFQKLVQRYETITLEEIDNNWRDVYPDENSRERTGFGSSRSCTLCRATATNKSRTNSNCDLCVYGEDFGCMIKINEKTYDRIADARTPEDLHDAYQARAAHLRKTYPQYL